MPLLSRRQCLAFSAAAAAGLSSSACRQAPSPTRPNILFVLADDQSYAHTGIGGSRIVSTPHFDRVAREGAYFSHSFTACPSCTPSRSAVLSGRHMWQVGEAGVLYGTIPRDLPLFPHALKKAGYWTGFTGKGWGPGEWQAAGLAEHPIGGEFNRRRHAVAIDKALDPRDYAANFEEFLQARPPGAPFFFWLGATEPHRVYARGTGLKLGKKLEDVEVPPYWPDHEIVRGDVLDYCAEIDWFDRQLGRALAVLERTGEMDNTIIVVTSDNGMPFPRAKANLYDSGTHMPLAIRWGRGLSAPGRRVEDMVSHVDFAPTFLEAAGLPPTPGMAGRSLLPLLTSTQPDPRRDRVYFGLERHTICRPNGATYPMRAMRTRDRLSIINFAPDRWPTGGEFISSNKTTHGDVDAAPIKDFMIARRREYLRPFELCFGRRPREENYAPEADPHHLQPSPGEDATLLSYLRATGDPRLEGRDIWQSFLYRQTIGFGASFNTALPEAERQAARDRATHKPE